MQNWLPLTSSLFLLFLFVLSLPSCHCGKVVRLWHVILEWLTADVCFFAFGFCAFSDVNMTRTAAAGVS